MRQTCESAFRNASTHASLALAADINPKVISERLGQATVSITLDTYSHADPGAAGGGGGADRGAGADWLTCLRSV